MKRMNSKPLTLYCFSPAVMFWTATIELFLALYAWWRYKHTVVAQMITLILLSLGIFQVAEYQICEGAITQNLLWTKIGLSAITLLPPLGLHLVELLVRRKVYWWFGYLSAIVYISLFVINSGLIQGATCQGNYVIIHTGYMAYGLYYFAFLFAAMIRANAYLVKEKNKASHQRRALLWLLVGYCSFILPMAVVYVLAPATRSAVPSVMCGFAVILAIILAGRVLPLAGKAEDLL